MSYGVSGFEGTRLMHINRRKNNTQHKGHYPAFGCSRDPELDVVPLMALKVLAWDLVCFAVQTSRVELVLKAVKALHQGRQFHPRRQCASSVCSRLIMCRSTVLILATLEHPKQLHTLSFIKLPINTYEQRHPTQ
jgi:hypothetical protein